MIGDEREVETQREPFSGDQEQKVEEDVQDVLGQDQRVQRVALIDRVLVIRLQLIKRDDLKRKRRKDNNIKICLLYTSPSPRD